VPAEIQQVIIFMKYTSADMLICWFSCWSLTMWMCHWIICTCSLWFLYLMHFPSYFVCAS